MSTSYTLLERDGLVVELDEGANKFSVDITGDITMMAAEEGFGAQAYTSRSIKPEEVVAMAMEMLKVATYWMSDEEFYSAVSSKLDGKHGHLTSYIRQMGELTKL